MGHRFAKSPLNWLASVGRKESSGEIVINPLTSLGHILIKGNSVFCEQRFKSSAMEVWMAVFDLTDFEWSVIASLLPYKPRGIARVDDRRVLNRIF